MLTKNSLSEAGIFQVQCSGVWFCNMMVFIYLFSDIVLNIYTVSLQLPPTCTRSIPLSLLFNQERERGADSELMQRRRAFTDCLLLFQFSKPASTISRINAEV